MPSCWPYWSGGTSGVFHDVIEVSRFCGPFNKGLLMPPHSWKAKALAVLFFIDGNSPSFPLVDKIPFPLFSLNSSSKSICFSYFPFQAFLPLPPIIWFFFSMKDTFTPFLSTLLQSLSPPVGCGGPGGIFFSSLELLFPSVYPYPLTFL